MDTNKPLSILTVSWLAVNCTPSETPITAADLLNGWVIRLFEEHKMGLLRVLTDRGTEFCGKVEIMITSIT